MPKKIVSMSFDKDTAILDLRLLTGEHYYVTSPSHALMIKNRINISEPLTLDQLAWLEQYRVPGVEVNKTQLIKKIKSLREELRK